MGSASGLYRGRILVSLKDFEIRLRNMIEEFSANQIEGLILSRRVFESHSALSWRIGKSSARVYVDEKDERLVEYLQMKDEETQKIIKSFMGEMTVLNLNLKVGWTIYLELCRTSRLSPDDIITPKEMPAAVDRFLANQ